MTELMVQRARVESEMIQVLTPDQKTKLAQLVQERRPAVLQPEPGHHHKLVAGFVTIPLSGVAAGERIEVRFEEVCE